MAENNATLKLQNGTHSDDNEDDLFGQPLYQNEIQVEGGEWYMNQDYTHRDASFEEILHLVHDFGFGVLNSDTGIAGSLPQFQLGVNYYQETAWKNKIWMPEVDKYNEWKDDISLDQEYFAAAIDAYYGLWGAWKSSISPNTSMWGSYKIKSRADFYNGGSDAVPELIKQVFHPTLQYTAYLSDQLSGEFSLQFDASKPYTNHSQYLTKIKLNGKKNVQVILNKKENTVTGNDGYTTVFLQGKKTDYIISNAKEKNGSVGILPISIYQGVEGYKTWQIQVRSA